MSTKTRLAAVSALSMAMMATPAVIAPAATAAAPTSTAVVSTSSSTCTVRTARTLHDVHVRTGARASTSSLGVLRAGRLIEVRGSQALRAGQWIPVHYQGQRGWIASREARSGRILAEAPWLAQRSCSAAPINRALTSAERAKIKRLGL
ncbi:MAG: SH3 domain-containing protein [Micrococcus sp.]|nr:SH3 domain-containing protein [Micrococcus sp.]